MCREPPTFPVCYRISQFATSVKGYAPLRADYTSGAPCHLPFSNCAMYSMRTHQLKQHGSTVRNWFAIRRAQNSCADFWNDPASTRHHWAGTAHCAASPVYCPRACSAGLRKSQSEKDARAHSQTLGKTSANVQRSSVATYTTALVRPARRGRRSFAVSWESDNACLRAAHLI